MGVRNPPFGKRREPGARRFKPVVAMTRASHVGAIAHCQTHHRSAHTYIVLKSLGYSRIRGYDGSWSECGNDPEVPIVS